MKTLIILWKRIWSDSPAILKRVKNIVLGLSAGLIAGSGAALAIIGQYETKLEWKEWLVGVLIFSAFVSSFITGISLATTNEKIQSMSDSETGLPK